MVSETPRLAPHNVEAEQSVLGAILLDSTAMALVKDSLLAEHFYRTAHQVIFQAMVALSQSGGVIDQIALTEHLKAQGQLDAVGGSAYLAELGWDVVSTAKIKSHAKMVREDCARRRAIAAAERVKQAAYNGASIADLSQHANGVQVPIEGNGADELDVTETAGLFTVRSIPHGVCLLFDRLTDHRGSVQAEVTISIGETQLLAPTDLPLKSEAARTKLASTLMHGVAASMPWPRLLDRACAAVLQRVRVGEPVIVLEPADSIQVPFAVHPLIYRGHQTLMFAPGGSQKSYLALFVALLASHGASAAGLSAHQFPVLFLDWELDGPTVGGRLRALQAGHPELAAYAPYYRRCEVPLHQEVPQIARQVAELGVELVIIDSVAMASGGDLASPDAAINLQRALRMIGGASLVLAHTSKAAPEGQEKTAYGTVFFRELARNVWECQRAAGDHPVRVALHHRKCNFGPMHPALGFEFTFSAEAVRISSCDPEEEPEFEDRLPVPSRIRNLLEDGTPRTARDIAEELTLRLGTVKSALSRGKGHKWQQIGEEYRNPQWTVLRAK